MVVQGHGRYSVNIGWVGAVRATLAVVLLTCAGCGGGVGEPDRDGDGLSDARELALGTDPDVSDTDQDGVSDGQEISEGTSPLSADSDGDGVVDGEDSTINPPTTLTGSNSSGNDVEPNDDFEIAVSLGNADVGSRAYVGQIDLSGDVDVFELGPVLAGDRMMVELLRVDDAFAPAVAIFDETGAVFDTETLSPLLRLLDSVNLIDEVVRRDSTMCFLAVGQEPESSSLGAYELRVEIERGAVVPAPIAQTVFLNFEGGSLIPPIVGVFEVDPFNAASIDPAYFDQGEVIKQAIVETVRDNFFGFDVVVLSSNDEGVDLTGSVSTVILGSFNDTVFGAAQGVDVFNLNRCDDGVVFAESFQPEVFGVTPPAVALGRAIGNVTAHEIGHLLGLRHVTDSSALMDEASPAPFLLSDQEFKTAPLSISVFPLGVQNARLLLADTVGTP